MDVVDAITRSRMMSGIRGKNTRQEILIRSGLHRKGLRFRIHVSDLAGKPDIVLPKYRVVVFVHGCFWHGHQGCRYFKLPSTRPEFWRMKIENNVLNDQRALRKLSGDSWRVAIVWECATKAKTRDQMAKLILELSTWITSDTQKSLVEFTATGGPFPIHS